MIRLTATARCLDGCGLLAQGDPQAVDKAGRVHTEKPPKHPTAVVAVPAC